MATDLLHHVTEIAWEAHMGQSDKAGEPYIFHVMRVMLRCRTEPDRLAALLHDVVEDTRWTLNGLRMEELPPWLIEAVDALTRRKEAGESYADYIERVAGNSIAHAVKLADLADNLSPERIAMLSPDEAASLSKRYHAAFRRLSLRRKGSYGSF